MVRAAASVAGVAALSAAITAAMAWPVLCDPTRRIFGTGIAGRHHDPVTVMWQMATGSAALPHLQPLTDWPGWLLARAVDPVAAYNVVVLATFPLTAITTWLLARALHIPASGATAAALIFTFAPVHLAHAAYHPHVAQTQWLPLYLLLLFALIARPTPVRAMGFLVGAAAVCLSNWYGALTILVATPAVLGVALIAARSAGDSAARTLIMRDGTGAATGSHASGGAGRCTRTRGVLAGAAMVGVAALAWAGAAVSETLSSYAVPASDVDLHSARWWSFAVPPVDHALLGPLAEATFERAGITRGLVEHQVYIGLAPVLLALVGVVAIVRRRAVVPRTWPLVALLAAGATALVVSLGPIAGSCDAGSWAPACLLHRAVPVFRAYARLAFVVQLAVAVLAGLGTWWLITCGRAGRFMAAGLVVVAVVEYWPLPARSRDVLPTSAHRWLAERAPLQRTLDCVEPEPAEQLTAWLMQRDLRPLLPPFASCHDPHLGGLLAAFGYTHVIVRGHSLLPRWHGPPALGRLAGFVDSRVYGVVSTSPPLVVLSSEGFRTRETNGIGWQEVRGHARWVVGNMTGQTIEAALELHLAAVDVPRALDVAVGDAAPVTVQVSTDATTYRLGPWSVPPGEHLVEFRTPSPAADAAAGGEHPDVRGLVLRGVAWVQ